MKLAFTFFALGVLVGVLIAPEKGATLREKLGKVGEDLAQAKKHLTEGSNDTDIGIGVL